MNATLDTLALSPVAVCPLCGHSLADGSVRLDGTLGAWAHTTCLYGRDNPPSPADLIRRELDYLHSYADSCRAQLLAGPPFFSGGSAERGSPISRAVLEQGISREAVVAPILERALTELN